MNILTLDHSQCALYQQEHLSENVTAYRHVDKQELKFSSTIDSYEC